MLRLLVCGAVAADALQVSRIAGRGSALQARWPEYDYATSKWSPGDDTEGYNAFGSLLRQGPLPFLIRLPNEDAYEQSVRKYMATEQCSRMEAQGNTDAYLANPNDWALQKMNEKEGAPKFDYASANTSKKDLGLTAVWVVIISTYLFSIFAPYAGLEAPFSFAK
ncbi:hypothetical protein M885DRAFT_538277 [Pelagophyceae sp. CCMP2097]|nr:hypothetical protein M885DRAFT_538277 [Pelagophyceae sp. CCMP2097]